MLSGGEYSSAKNSFCFKTLICCVSPDLEKFRGLNLKEGRFLSDESFSGGLC